MLTRIRHVVMANVLRRGLSRPAELAHPRSNSNRRQQCFSVYDPDYSGLQVHDGNDGAWWCERCGQQNLLKIREDRHPFGQLICARCDHVLDSKDVSTNVLSGTIQCDEFHPDRVLVPEGKASGVICPGCGKTHVGVRLAHQDVPWHTTYDFSRIVCHCGCRGGGRYLRSWYRFCIGSCRDWHEDRVGAEGRAMEERLERRFAAH
jgi:hypothetical protein